MESCVVCKSVLAYKRRRLCSEASRHVLPILQEWLNPPESAFACLKCFAMLEKVLKLRKSVKEVEHVLEGYLAPLTPAISDRNYSVSTQTDETIFSLAHGELHSNISYDLSPAVTDGTDQPVSASAQEISNAAVTDGTTDQHDSASAQEISNVFSASPSTPRRRLTGHGRPRVPWNRLPTPRESPSLAVSPNQIASRVTGLYRLNTMFSASNACNLC